MYFLLSRKKSRKGALLAGFRVCKVLRCTLQTAALLLKGPPRQQTNRIKAVHASQ